MTRAVIIGAGGRMGRALLQSAPAAGVTVSAALVRPGSPALGQDAGTAAGLPPLGLPLSCDLTGALATADVVLDFSRPEALPHTLAACVAARRALLVGTTGLTDALKSSLRTAAGEIAVLVAPNTSLGVALLTELTRLAARALPDSFDIEILESHHRGKRDAPSGTALSLSKAAAEGRGIAPPAGVTESGRTGRALPRVPGEIGFAVVRGGNIVGEHTVLLAGDGEELLLTHRATDRRIFAQGALRAALWLAQAPAGNYTMQDLFKLNQ